MAIDPDRLRSELKRVRELIATDERVLARFDTDGNGVIDGQEWEAVRQLVIDRLERDARETAEAERIRERLQAEAAAQRASEKQAPSTTPGDDRDWSNLELAFDPREDRRVQDRAIAEEVYEREVASRHSHARTASSVRTSEHGTLADCHELVLEQVGGVKQFFGNMFRREYIIRGADGEEVGRIGQHENEMLQDLTNYRIFEDPDLNFVVHDHTSDEHFNLQRTSGFSDNSIAVQNPKGMTVARTSWTLSFLRRKYEIRVMREKLSYYVQRRMLRPWTYDILDPFERPIGAMHRGWSGLGFVTGGNLFHIELETDISPDAMWGFLGAAMLADLDSERNSRRKSFLDVLNH
jgi:hypothetical protein